MNYILLKLGTKEDNRVDMNLLTDISQPTDLPKYYHVFLEFPLKNVTCILLLVIVT